MYVHVCRANLCKALQSFAKICKDLLYIRVHTYRKVLTLVVAINTLNNSQNNTDNKSTLHKMVNTFQFLKIGLNYCGQGNLCVNMEDRKPVSKTIKRRFRSHFGTTPALCAYLWDRIDKLSLPAGAKWYHLLWALLFLKLYATEEVLSGMVRKNLP